MSSHLALNVYPWRRGGDITDVLFDGATFTHTLQAVDMKSLAVFVGTASNITYTNFRLNGVPSAVVVNMFNQGSTGTDLDTNTDATIEITDTANTSLGLPAMQRLGRLKLPMTDQPLPMTDQPLPPSSSLTGGNIGTYPDSYTMPSAHNILIQNISGTAKVAGKIECGAGESACYAIRMVAVKLESSVAGARLSNFTCKNAEGREEGCSPAPCGW
jgi:hypothetical protein